MFNGETCFKLAIRNKYERCGDKMSTLPTEFERTEIGEIQIAPEVIEVIAGLATVEVKGVAGMSGGFAGGIVELLGRKNLSKALRWKSDSAKLLWMSP